MWNDTNGNGIQDGGEPGVPNVSVALLKDCGGNLVIATTTTDANGIYTFANLTFGQYRVQVSLPAGFQFSPQNQGGNDAVDSDVNIATGISECITLTAGQNDPSWDAGISSGTPPTPTPTPTPGGGTASVGDKVWDDLNKDGIQGADEPGLGGVKVALYNNATGTLLFAQQTPANGDFLFTNLAPGSYYLCFQPPPVPPIYVVTAKLQGSDRNLDNDADPATGCTAPFTLNAGQVERSIDGGFYDPPAAFASGTALVNLTRVYLPLVIRR